MMDVVRFIGSALVTGLLVFLAYLWMETEKEKDKVKKLLEEERKKVRSESETRDRAECKLSAAKRLIEKLKAQNGKLRDQNKELEGRLNKLWEETARLRKPAGTGPKKSTGE